jgi:dihydrofolate reductase
MMRGIIAMSDNRMIGKGHSLPWANDKGDLKFFKEKTIGHNLIMGKTTFKSLGRVHLPFRKIYVLTHHFNSFGWNVSATSDASTHIITSLEDLPKQDYWVCGGKSIYELFLPKMAEFFVTYIKGDFDGDVEMPFFENQFSSHREIVRTDNYRTVWYWR